MTGQANDLIGMWTTPTVDWPAAPSADDDATLIEAASDDPAAFARLYRRYVTPVYRYLFSRTATKPTRRI